MTQVIPDPILAAIEAHRQAYAAYDLAAAKYNASSADKLSREEQHAAFDALERACQRLVGAEFTSFPGLVALLHYMGPLLQEEGTPALPLEVIVEDQQWETVFGMFCANLAKRLVGILTTDSAVTPEYVDWVADDIIGATGDLFDDYDVVRKIARAAIASVAEYRAEAHS
jgi:hypothetical protein